MEHIITIIAAGYLLLISIIGFSVMGIDKNRARKRKWRIPERTLISIAFFGGGIGSFLGMVVFRHKTKHIKFQISLPIAAILYIYLCYQLMIHFYK